MCFRMWLAFTVKAFRDPKQNCQCLKRDHTSLVGHLHILGQRKGLSISRQKGETLLVPQPPNGLTSIALVQTQQTSIAATMAETARPPNATFRGVRLIGRGRQSAQWAARDLRIMSRLKGQQEEGRWVEVDLTGSQAEQDHNQNCSVHFPTHWSW